MPAGTIQLDDRQPIRRHCLCRYVQTWVLWWLNEWIVKTLANEYENFEFEGKEASSPGVYDDIVKESMFLWKKNVVKLNDDTEPSHFENISSYL